jgi:hypothetical protein
MTKQRRFDPKIRFMRNVPIASSAECWPWLGAVGTHGYGQFWMDGRQHNASRVAFLLLVGPIEDGLVVCHTCDNRLCVNPMHLWIGTQGDNVRDCNAKGRGRGKFSDTKGAAHPRYTAKLTAEKVREAKRLHYVDGVSQSEIARRWGVNSGTISRAVRGEKWAHVK